MQVPKYEPVRLVTSLDMIFDIQAGETEFKFLCRSVCHNFPNISQADSAELTTYALELWTNQQANMSVFLWIAAMTTMLPDLAPEIATHISRPREIRVSQDGLLDNTGPFFNLWLSLLRPRFDSPCA